MSPARRAEAALVGIAVVWGLTFVMVQDAVERLPVTAFLAYRFIPAALIVAFVARRRLRGLGRAGLAAGLGMGAFLAAGYLLQTFGLEATSASSAGFITGLFVVITPLLGALVFRQPVPRIAWAAAGVSAAGLFLLSGGGTSFTLRGDGLVLGCAVAFSAHILATDRAVAAGHDAGALLAVQLAVVGVASLAIAIPAGDLEVPRGAEVWSALLVTTLVASALGYYVQTYAQRHADPARTALILAAEPAFAGVFGFLLAGDHLGVSGWIGAALILGAIVAVDLVPRLRPRRPLPEG